jgi:hypothetical protein
MSFFIFVIRPHIRNYKNTSITKFYERLAKRKRKGSSKAASKLLKNYEPIKGKHIIINTGNKQPSHTSLKKIVK